MRTCLPQASATSRTVREPAPDASDGLHARLHHALLQFGRDQVEPLPSCHQIGVFHFLGELEDLVARQHQLPDQVHQLVEQCNIHADGAFARALAVRLLSAQRLEHLMGLHRALFDENFADAPRVTRLLFLYGVFDLTRCHIAAADQNVPKGWAQGIAARGHRQCGRLFAGHCFSGSRFANSRVGKRRRVCR
jgi:hypothetical protein